MAGITPGIFQHMRHKKALANERRAHAVTRARLQEAYEIIAHMNQAARAVPSESHNAPGVPDGLPYTPGRLRRLLGVFGLSKNPTL
jgi:hypothetical protein